MIEQIERICESHGRYKTQALCVMNNTIIYEQCPYCLGEHRARERKRLEAEARERAIKEHQDFIDTLRKRGCGNDYINKRSSLNYSTQLLSEKLKQGGQLGDFLKIDGRDFARKENIFILGSCGIGKTFFASKMVEEALNIRKKYIILAGFELVSIYYHYSINGFSKLNSAENIEAKLKDVDCLIIDEIDYFLRDTRTPKEKEVLEIVTHFVSKNGIRTIALGNCQPQELRALDSKILSRLFGGFIMEFWGMNDLRWAKNA